MERTGSPPGLLQDHSRELSRWLATRPGARRQAKESAMMTNFDKMHPSLQIAIREWLIAKMPRAGEALQQRIKMPSGYYMTEDQVVMHMATAAMAVLAQACESAGLDGR